MKKALLLATLCLGVTTTANAQGLRSLNDPKIPFPSVVAGGKGSYTVTNVGVAFGGDWFKGIEGVDYVKFVLDRPLTNDIVVSQCLRVAQMLYVFPASFQYESPDLAVYSDNSYLVTGNGLVKTYGGSTAAAHFSCLARRIGNMAFFLAQSN